ncbi:MAG: metal-sulfur cluster assembly factor [Acidobacteriota bacterium]|jgi:metal-sulfur cluster biosynthetic enzyme
MTEEQSEAKETQQITEEQCFEALMNVLDPELGLDAVSLGLIYKLEVKGNVVDVDMTMTSPGCPVVDQMIFQAQNELVRLPGIEQANVNLVWSPPWTPEMMSLEAKMALGFA